MRQAEEAHLKKQAELPARALQSTTPTASAKQALPPEAIAPNEPAAASSSPPAQMKRIQQGDRQPNPELLKRKQQKEARRKHKEYSEKGKKEKVEKKKPAAQRSGSPSTLQNQRPENLSLPLNPDQTPTNRDSTPTRSAKNPPSLDKLLLAELASHNPSHESSSDSSNSSSSSNSPREQKEHPVATDEPNTTFSLFDTWQDKRNQILSGILPPPAASASSSSLLTKR
jgi:hypothetical protein